MSVRGRKEREFDNEVREESRANIGDIGEVSRVDEQRFTKEMASLIKDAEDLRLNYMRKHRMRNWISMNLSILTISIGSAAFGWFFMMEAQLLAAFVYLFASVIPTFFLGIWAKRPIESYARAHKSVFMPKMAKTLGGLNYHPFRGVSSKTIKNLPVIPSHDRYEAEDCFMGRYKGMKVILSEARLYSRNHKGRPVFDGLFVLLEAPKDIFEGQTIITADEKMMRAYASTRWKNMIPVTTALAEPQWDKFKIFSTKPDTATYTVNEHLLKELAEAGDVFDKAPISAVLFKKRYVFLMIEHDKDMFEASDLFIPVTTKDQALRVKKEIEQLIEIVDVFDLYQNPK